MVKHLLSNIFGYTFEHQIREINKKTMETLEQQIQNICDYHTEKENTIEEYYRRNWIDRDEYDSLKRSLWIEYNNMLKKAKDSFNIEQITN